VKRHSTRPLHPHRHIGPGKRVVSLYADAALMQASKARARSLGLSMSAYVAALVRADLNTKGPLLVPPHSP
jgi:hypothetical protein